MLAVLRSHSARWQLRPLPVFAWLLQHHFARNWSIMVFASVVGQGLGMLATIRIARALTPEGYGAYNMVATMALLGAIVTGLGLRNVVIRECARHPERTPQVFRTAALLRLLPACVAAGGILVYVEVSQTGLPFVLGVIAIALLAGQTTFDLVECVAFGHQRMEFSAAINLTGSVCWVIAVWSQPSAWITPVNVSLAFAGLQAVKSIAYAIVVRRVWSLHPFERPTAARLSASIRSILAQGLPFYWTAILT